MMMDKSVSVVRGMTPADLRPVLRIYRDSLEGGFFADLGDAFLESYLGTYLSSPYGVAVVAESQGEIVGFLFGAVDMGKHRDHIMTQERRRLLVRGVRSLAVRPLVALRFLRTRLVRYTRAVASGGASPSSHGVAVLSHIAVEQRARGIGLGSALERRFVEGARTAGASSLRLVTATGDRQAQEFYLANGWEEAGEHTDRDGKEWTTMEKKP